ncbi:MAG TPA: hypothetical protein VF489_12410 [Sphingobium sp.]
MSARFWLLSMSSAGAALATGLGLGLYATTPPRVALTDHAETRPTGTSDAAPDLTSLNGPAEIRCTGCGPTLADRQMAATMGDWAGYDDPMVQDGVRDDEAPEDLLPAPTDPPPSPAHRLPANIDRFAAGDVAAQSEQWAQGGASPSFEEHSTAVPDRF